MPVEPDESAASRLRETIARVPHAGAILSAAATAFPEVVAVAEAPRQPGNGRRYYRQMTFGQLDAWATRIAAGLQRAEVPEGSRLALMVPPGIDFVALVFGLMKAGMVSILIDPGMGKRHLIGCLSEARPEGFVGISKAQLLRVCLPRSFADARFNFGVGCRWPGLPSIQSFRDLDPASFVPPEIGLATVASYIFTSGSTGPPKGVEYRHRNFVHQASEISQYFRLPPASVDISGFPLFALFNAAMAATTVFPRMDFTRPAAVNPRRFVASVDDWTATQSFGSPALWNTVSRYCVQRHIRLASIRHVLTAGAPVPAYLLARCKSIIAAEGEVHTPYGATEALPVACITAGEVLTQTASRSADGAGTCVGRPFPEIEWRVIAIDDHAIPDIGSARLLPTGQIGELIVRGPVVTERYVTRIEANARHKVADGHSTWHRMGDVGYLDRDNRFWFCGRLTQRVQTRQGNMFTIPCEAIINGHPAIYRSALVGIGPPGEQIPAIIAEPWPEHWPRFRTARRKLLEQIAATAEGHRLTQSIRHFFLRRRLPVDIRHNAKIFREQLAIWAARQPSLRSASLTHHSGG
jgi:acyl-CoA synthetase (AMP-forming)/AMP-acid ligase II